MKSRISLSPPLDGATRWHQTVILCTRQDHTFFPALEPAHDGSARQRRSTVPKTTIAIAQFESSRNVVENRDKLVSITEKAADAGARLVLFHEIASTHYFCYDKENTDHFDLAEPIPGPTTAALVDTARRLGVGVLLPIYEAAGADRFNTVVHVDAKDGINGKYRKTHVPSMGDYDGQGGGDESFYFSAGDTGYVLPPPIEGISTGTLICYDRHFPEGGRSYAVRGAQLIFVPTASYRGHFMRELWKAELQTMAFQNSIYVAGVNKVGPVLGEAAGRDARYPGMSVVVNPEGKIIAECGSGEEIAYAEVDTEFCEQVRHGPVGHMKSRRPEYYGALTQA